MVSFRPLTGVIPLPNGRTSWLINGGYLYTNWDDPPSRSRLMPCQLGPMSLGVSENHPLMPSLPRRQWFGQKEVLGLLERRTFCTKWAPEFSVISRTITPIVSRVITHISRVITPISRVITPISRVITHISRVITPIVSRVITPISRVITAISRVISPQLPIYFRPSIGVVISPPFKKRSAKPIAHLVAPPNRARIAFLAVVRWIVLRVRMANDEKNEERSQRRPRMSLNWRRIRWPNRWGYLIRMNLAMTICARV